MARESSPYTPTADAYRSHPREFGTFRYVYPVLSRRSAGISLGINLNPDRACNFDCVYCQVDHTREPVVEFLDLPRLLDELDAALRMAANGALFANPPFTGVNPDYLHLRDLAFSGDGEPTAVRNFETIVDRVLVHKDRADCSTIPLRLLTNATLLDRPGVARAVDRLHQSGGEVWAKLDAGTEAIYRRINRCVVPFATVLRNLCGTARRFPLVLQSLFLKWEGVDPSDGEVDQYVDRIAEILSAGGRIARVQVYTIARPPAESAAQPLGVARLVQIAESVRRRTNLSVETFPAP